MPFSRVKGGTRYRNTESLDSGLVSAFDSESNQWPEIVSVSDSVSKILFLWSRTRSQKFYSFGLSLGIGKRKLGLGKLCQRVKLPDYHMKLKMCALFRKIARPTNILNPGLFSRPSTLKTSKADSESWTSQKYQGPAFLKTVLVHWTANGAHVKGAARKKRNTIMNKKGGIGQNV